MLWRAIFAFLALPGVVAILVPGAIAWNRSHASKPWLFIGLTLFVAGFASLLWCVRDFYVSGKGTLAPWSPPKHLVKVGLYRYTRNPMYVAVALMLIGWSVGFTSLKLATYTGIVLLAFHLRVVFGEEPWLARTHGTAWDEYRARVPRWLL
jgi:protein-S-isoprenylcysteine O-methyltransferase Ste14